MTLCAMQIDESRKGITSDRAVFEDGEQHLRSFTTIITASIQRLF